MSKAIPTKIKPYPGLVKAWKARHGSPGRSYDPPGKKRSTRHKNPKLKTGYGKINKKPFARGERGGVAWTGGKTPRYDPTRRKSIRHRAKSKLEGIFNKLENKLVPLCDLFGFLGTLVMGIKTGHDTYVRGYGENATDKYIKTLIGGDGRIAEVAHLWTWEKDGFNPLSYMRYKLFGAFEGKESAWSAPFVVSLIIYLACKFGLLDAGLSIITTKSARIVKPIQKLAGGAVIASTIGALVLPGCPGSAPSGNPGHSTTPTHNPSRMWS